MSASLPLPSDGLALIPVPTLALGVDGVIDAANPAAAELFGRSTDALGGTPFADLVHPDAKAPDLDDIQGAPLRILGSDGETCYVRLFSRPVDGGGALVCLMPAPADGIVADISGGLIDATLLARAVHAADNSIVVADVSKPEQPLVFVNRGFLSLTGYEADEVVGQNCRFLQAPGGARLDNDALPDAIAKARRGEPLDDAAEALRRAIDARETIDGLVIRNYTADGHAFWNELYLTPVEDEDGVSHYVGVQNDVTERVEAQRTLRRRAAQLKDLFDAMPEPLGLIEAYDGGALRHVLCNAASAEAFELGDDTEVGLDGLGFRGEARVTWIDAVHECESSGSPVIFEAPRSDTRVFEVVVSPVERSAGQPDRAGRYFYLARDVTDGRRLEDDVLRISGRELAQVAQNIHDGVGQTLVGASMLSSAVASALRNSRHEATGDAERLHDLVRASLSQLRQFALGIDPVDIDDLGLDATLSRLASDLSALFGIRMTYQGPDRPADLPAEMALDVYRIVQEAATNAIRHGHADHVHVALMCTDDLLELTVEDNGDGISDAALADADGMGLRTMRARARRLGGPLRIARQPRGGTEVHVRAVRTLTPAADAV